MTHFVFDNNQILQKRTSIW